MSNYIEADYGNFDEFIKTVHKSKKHLKEKEKSHCGNILTANMDTTISKIIKTFIPKLLSEKDKIISDIKKNEEEQAFKQIKGSFLSENNEQKLIEKVKEIYAEKTNISIFDFNKEHRQLQELSKQFNEDNFWEFESVEFQKPNWTENAEIVFKNNLVKHAILGLGVANLSYSIIHLTNAFVKHDALVKQFSDKINEIKTKFENHKKKLI